MNPTPPSLHFHSPHLHCLFSLPDLSRGVTVSYSLICVNPCFRQHGGRRVTSPKRHRWADVAAWLPDSGSSAEARHSKWWVSSSWESQSEEERGEGKKKKRRKRKGKQRWEEEERERETYNLWAWMMTVWVEMLQGQHGLRCFLFIKSVAACR